MMIMVILEPKEYSRVLAMLPGNKINTQITEAMLPDNKINTQITEAMLPGNEMNTLFAEAILRGMIKGEVLAEKREQPAWFYIRHPCHMTLLVGNPVAVTDYDELKAFLLNEEKLRNEVEWMQVYPSGWNQLLKKMLGHHLIDKGPDEQYRKPLPMEENCKVISYRRSDFAFQREGYETYRQKNQSDHVNVLETDRAIYQQQKEGVVPSLFWDSYKEFIAHGTGFTAFTPDGIPASTAFAAFVIGKQFEIGIETMESYRGQGYAHIACSRLIEYCVEKDYEPVWGCNSGNIGSRSLALKLGFTETVRRPYYRLPV
jgi:RimJ/RimL family protein N-acetyltransferase